MLSDKMAQVLNEQLNREMYSAFLYMSMSAHCSDIGLKGFANWFMVQYHEEMFHAMKIYEYIQRQGARVQLAAIEAPPAQFDSPLEMFERTLEHERFITSSINTLMDLAISEHDHASQIFLQWYVSEQVEEEENDNDLISQLRLMGDDPRGLMMLDRELASRTATVVTDFSKGVASVTATQGT